MKNGFLQAYQYRPVKTEENAVMGLQRKSVLGAVLLLSAGLITTLPAYAERSERFAGTFAAEHSATTKPDGRVDALFYPAAHVLRYTITWSGLSGGLNAAHFHGPAGPGEGAAPVITIKGPYKSPLTGSVSLNKDQEDMLENGKLYVNLHTQAYPKGEARAQLTK